ncbi:hypothetical protein ACOSP7_024870 [Xanthoceras sorbifolium]
MKFNYVEFWAQNFDVPLMCRTRDIGLFLGKQIGIVYDIDVGASGDCMGKYIRVRVGVDIDKPLKRCLRVHMGDSNGVVVMLLRYERLPEYCFGCGFVNHSIRECLKESSPPVIEGKEQIRFGAWFFATNPPRVVGPH